MFSTFVSLGNIITAAALLLSLLGASHPARSEERIKAAQVFHTYSKTFAEFDAELTEMKARGINTIIFRVFGNPGDRIFALANPQTTSGVYFKTAHAPVIDDLLGTVATLAHSHGMKLFAWMTTRKAVYGVDESLFDSRYDLKTRSVVRINKLDLFNPESLSHLVALYADLAAYPIDGVLLQDDFIIKHMEGAGPHAKARFASEFMRMFEPGRMYTELELKPGGRVRRIVYTDEFWAWAKWKNRRLIEVAEVLIRTIKHNNPAIKTCLNTFYEMYLKPRNTLSWQSQNTELADMFDLVAVMAYHRQIMDELGISRKEAEMVVKRVTEEAITKHGAKKVIIKLQTIDWKKRKKIPAFELREIYKTINSVSTDVGVAFGPWEGRMDLDLNERNSRATKLR
ncbi:MAG: poly-beta-1,6-N-acetyl-D-glucosamine N-deacetylase PgaB [Thermodesulfobacteriota bacterium]